MEKSGAEILIETLLEEGVEVMFGYPGGVLLHIFDVLFDSPIKFILTRHEQAAVHAADGYARATGKVGVCIATSGPGATNLTTGIANAYMDSAPIVAITGQVPTALIGGDAFQEADAVGITRSITKYNYLVKDPRELHRIVKEAFYIAKTGRPGPVLIDVPRDVSSGKAVFEKIDKVKLRSYNPVLRGNPKQVERAVSALIKAEKPVIYAGGGVIISGADKELRELAEQEQMPVTLTLMGLGAFPGTHPLFMGMLGMHGTWTANRAVRDCDLLIAIGARFDDRVTGKLDEFAPNAQVIHIDIDPSSISKNISAHIPIVGDVKTVLGQLLEEIKKHPHTIPAHRKHWLSQIEAWEEEHSLRYEPSKKFIRPQLVVEKIYKLTKGDAVITTEVGQNQMWAAQFYKFDQPRTLITSGGLGTMGYGFPAAIGAKLGRPDKVVVDIAGDGSIQMNIQELATVAQYHIPVKVAILNNQFLGMVRQWQELFYNKRYSHTCIACQPNFKLLAEAYGVKGYIITDPEEVEPVLKEALFNDEPCLMDFRVHREENVLPIIPPGKTVYDTIVAPPVKKNKKKQFRRKG